MRSEKYKKYIVKAHATSLKGTLGWSAEFELEKHAGDDVTSTPFDIRGTYRSEESAIEAAILHGRKKIDDGFSISI